MMSTHWIATFTGRQVFPTAMTPDQVCVEDIAHALSLINRFTGHTRVAYSVAQHSVLVSLICRPENALWGLLHDAAEAYMADVSRPVKQAIREITPALDLIESGIMAAVCHRFGLPLTEPEDVGRCDNDMLAHEAEMFFGHQPLYEKWQHHRDKWWTGREEEFKRQKRILQVRTVVTMLYPVTAEQAEERFLARFRELTPPYPGERS
jgi:uncharacterized protein